MIVATAEATLAAATSTYETILRTGLNTPLGEVLIIQVLSVGNMLIGGPSQVSQIRSLIDKLEGICCQQILIDGAFARETFASVSDATILCVGANHSPNMDLVIRHAAATLHKYSLPLASSMYRSIGMKKAIVAVDTTLYPTELSYDSTIAIDGAFFEQIQSDIIALMIPKAIGDSFANEWLKRRKNHLIPWIIDNPTQLVLSDKTLERIFTFNQPIFCLHPATIVAVCYNPYAPSGHEFDDSTFLKQLASITKLPIYNVLSERGANHE